MASFRQRAAGALCLTGVLNIAAPLRRDARRAERPLTYLNLT
ncbi:hypothetical protein ACFYO2_43340 [Streptomyces sp. NPDC006602]